jgi:hypothetical protein
MTTIERIPKTGVALRKLFGDLLIINKQADSQMPAC